MIGTMSMFYVTNPDKAVALIQGFIDDESQAPDKELSEKNNIPEVQDSTIITPKVGSKRHSLDTREKIRDVLR